MRKKQSGAVPPPWLAEKGSSKDSSGPSTQRPDEASRAATQLAPDTRANANRMGRKVGTLGASRPLLRCPVPRPKCPSRRTATAVAAGCPLVAVPGPRSQQMSCQRSRVERRACVPPVSSQMERSRRQSRDQ